MEIELAWDTWDSSCVVSGGGVRLGHAAVAGRLAKSPIYAGKDLRSLLATFNPARNEYPDKVIGWMERIAPTPSAAAGLP